MLLLSHPKITPATAMAKDTQTNRIELLAPHTHIHIHVYNVLMLLYFVVGGWPQQNAALVAQLQFGLPVCLIVCVRPMCST